MKKRLPIPNALALDAAVIAAVNAFHADASYTDQIRAAIVTYVDTLNADRRRKQRKRWGAIGEHGRVELVYKASKDDGR